jgi:uncharacterized protein DUF4350
MKGSRLVAVLAVIVAAVFAVWCYFNFGYVTEREYVGYQGEARRNHLLAAMRLFEHMGVPSREASRVAELDALPAGATLILTSLRSAMTARQVPPLLEWVAAGGHLIVDAEYHHAPDPLLDALKVGRRELRLTPPARPSEVALPHAPRPLKVDFGHRQHLIDLEGRANFTVDERWSILLLQFTIGQGRVTVLNGMRYMSNRAIGEHDHAEFAWQLVRFNPATSAVVVVARLEQRSLAKWLAEHGWQALAAGTLLLVLWLWHIVPRFGPLEPDRPPARRRLLDHLRASGLFHWSRGGTPLLLDAAREACLRKISRTHPGLLELPPADRSRQFAALTGLPAHDIELALGGTAAEPHQFTTAVRVLQTLEERLTRKAVT